MPINKPQSLSDFDGLRFTQEINNPQSQSQLGPIDHSEMLWFSITRGEKLNCPSLNGTLMNPIKMTSKVGLGAQKVAREPVSSGNLGSPIVP